VAVDVYTGVSRVSVAEEVCDQLAERLERFGAPGAARRLRERHLIRQEDRPVVREVLGRWRQSLGTVPLAERLYEFQEELGKGLWAEPSGCGFN
jgi:hypothetical protein